MFGRKPKASEVYAGLSEEGKGRMSVFFKDKDIGKVFDCLMYRGQMADEIARDTDIPPQKVVKILQKLEKQGFVRLVPQ